MAERGGGDDQVEVFDPLPAPPEVEALLSEDSHGFVIGQNHAVWLEERSEPLEMCSGIR